MDSAPIRVPVQVFRRDLADYLNRVSRGEVVLVTRHEKVIAECRCPADVHRVADTPNRDDGMFDGHLDAPKGDTL